MDLDTEQEDRLKQGGIAGAAAFVVGLIATVVVAGTPGGSEPVFRVSALGMSTDVTWSQLGSSAGSQPPSYKVGGWLYHQAHMASVEATITGQSGSGSASGAVQYVLEPASFVYLIPLVVVAGAAYWVVDQSHAEDPTEAAKNGAYVAVGYAVVALVSVFVLSWTSSSGSGQAALTVQPELASGVLVTGIIYPVVVGGATGYLKHEYLDDADDTAAGGVAADGAPADSQRDEE